MPFFCLLGLCLWMGTPAAGGTGPPWRTNTWTMREDLPQDSVTDVLQSSDGYVWVTTFGGIARFDGQSFETYSPARTEGLHHTRFVSLAEAADGSLWFAVEDGGVYRLADDEMTLIDERRVLHLEADEDGRVWGAALEHFVRYDETGTHEVPVTGGTAHFLARLPGGGLLGSGRTIAPTCLAGACGKLPPPPTWTGADYLRWSQDRRGRFWVSSHDRLVHYERGRWQTDRLGDGLALQAGFAIDWDRHEWVVDDGRLAAVGPRTRDAPPVFDAPIRATWVDDLDGLWVGLDGGGLVHLVPQPARLHTEDGESVFSLAPRGLGVWASSCTGLIAVDAEPPPSWSPWEIFRCPRVWGDGQDGVLFYGARRPGVPLAVLRHRESGTPELVASLDPKHPDRFFAAHEGPWFVYRDQVYAVPRSGRARPLLRARDLGATEVQVLHGPPAPEVPALERAVWLVLDRTRLVLWKEGQVLRDVTLHDAPPVRDLLVNGDRTWVSTYGAGLVALNGDTVEATLTAAQGLCDDSLSHLYRTADGRLWVNTNRGVGFVEESDLEEVIAGQRDRFVCIPVTTEEANGPTGLLGKDGRLWAPTTDGVAEIDTRGARVPTPPPLRLERATYRGQDLRRVESSRVRGPGILSLRFVALDFARPREVQYRYRLEGPTSSEGWSAVTRSRELHLGPLDPGSYRFEVQALAPGAPWTTPRTLTFVRQPFFGETVWVRTVLPLSLFGLVVVGIVVGWQRDRRARMALQREVEERQRAEERANAEQEHRARAQAELEASRRLQSLGRLAGGVAHDFNNLLVVVASHATLLGEHVDREVRQSARELSELVRRATELVRQLLVVGQRDNHAPVLVELGTALDALMPLLRRMIRDNVVITLTREARCWVNIDPARLDRVVTNLVINGAEAIDEDGRIGISVREGETASGPCAEIQVTDTGPGLTAEQLEHALEPYYTTKTASQGTGLGLATVHGAVQEAGGTLRLGSPKGRGACVVVELPLVRSAPMTMPASATNGPDSLEPSTAPHETDKPLRVLIVDDQEYLARAVARMASRLGWKPRTATGLEGAVELALSEPFDLLLSDVVMPGADGPAVHAAVRAVQAGLPVLYMTGYAAGVLGDALGEHVVLRKPFTSAELEHAVDIALAEARRERASGT